MSLLNNIKVTWVLYTNSFKTLVKKANGYASSKTAKEALYRFKRINPIIRALKYGIKHNEFYIKEEAVSALGRIGGKKAVKVLIDLINDRNENTKNLRSKAQNELKYLKDEKAIVPLINSFNDEYSYEAKYALEYYDKTKVIDPLINALHNEDYLIRKGAAQVLGDIGDKKAVDSLIEALDDDVGSVREYAAISLGKIGGKRTLDELIKALKDKNIRVKEYAAEYLGKIGDKKAIDPLLQCFDDLFKQNKRNLNNSEVRDCICEIEKALANLGYKGDKYIEIKKIADKVKKRIKEESDRRSAEIRAEQEENERLGGLCFRENCD